MTSISFLGFEPSGLQARHAAPATLFCMAYWGGEGWRGTRHWRAHASGGSAANRFRFRHSSLSPNVAHAGETWQEGRVGRRGLGGCRNRTRR
eukprot:358957-Chlamydomonas_euryale.AAC.4